MFLFLVTPCLVVAILPSMEWIPIKKIHSPNLSHYLPWSYFICCLKMLISTWKYWLLNQGRDEKLGYKFKSFTITTRQRHTQKPVELLRRSLLQKQLTTFSRQLFLQKAPSQMFDRVLKTPLLRHIIQFIHCDQVVLKEQSQ